MKLKNKSIWALAAFLPNAYEYHSCSSYWGFNPTVIYPYSIASVPRHVCHPQKKTKRIAQMCCASPVHEQWQPGNPCASNTFRNRLMLPHQVSNDGIITENTGMSEDILVQMYKDFKKHIEKTKYNLKCGFVELCYI